MDRSLLDLLRCPRSAQALELHAAHVDAIDGGVDYGLLTAEGFAYPIVAGIPVLTPGVEPVVELVRAERFQEAAALAALGTLERSRSLPLVTALASLRGIGRIARGLEGWMRDRKVASDAHRLFGDPPGHELVADPLELLFLDGRHPSREGYNYFRYRFGTPRYLVSLALLDALPPAAGPAVDVGCGAGHLTWALTQRIGSHPVVGVDPSLAQLLVAARLAPRAQFVCGDGQCLPLRTGAFGRVLSSDVLPYVVEKPAAARELERVLAPTGQVVLTALRNARQQHVHAGEPLTPQSWGELLADLPYRRLLADDAVLDCYLAGRAPGELTEAGIDVSQTLSVLAAHHPVVLRDGAWETWPHARGVLAPHPLLQPVTVGEGGVVHERRFPSDVYQRDNRRIVEYLPATCTLPAEALRHPVPTGASEDVEIQRLIEMVALLALPELAVRAGPSRG